MVQLTEYAHFEPSYRQSLLVMHEHVQHVFQIFLAQMIFIGDGVGEHPNHTLSVSESCSSYTVLDYQPHTGWILEEKIQNTAGFLQHLSIPVINGCRDNWALVVSKLLCYKFNLCTFWLIYFCCKVGNCIALSALLRLN